MDINQHGPKSVEEYEIARLRAQVAGQQAQIAEKDKEIAFLTEAVRVSNEDAKHFEAKALGYEARIAELLAVLKRCYMLDLHDDALLTDVVNAISRTDDLSALATHDAAVRKAALLEAAAVVRASASREHADLVLCDMAEGEK